MPRKMRDSFAGIVVGQRHNPESFKSGHSGDVFGRHVVVPAGRKTGVNMQIVKIFIHDTADKFPRKG